jgi:hypothetical protein
VLLLLEVARMKLNDFVDGRKRRLEMIQWLKLKLPIAMTSEFRDRSCTVESTNVPTRLNSSWPLSGENKKTHHTLFFLKKTNGDFEPGTDELEPAIK